MEDNSQVEFYVPLKDFPEETSNVDVTVLEKSSQEDLSVTRNNVHEETSNVDVFVSEESIP